MTQRILVKSNVPYPTIVFGFLAVLAACDSTDTGSTLSTPFISSLERDRETIDAYTVGSSVVQIPRKFAANYPRTNMLEVTAYWPELTADAGIAAAKASDGITLVFEPLSILGAERDLFSDDQAFDRSLSLTEPQRNHELQLKVYRDVPGQRRLMVSENYRDPNGKPIRIRCAHDKSENAPICDWRYAIAENLLMQVRIFADQLPDWRAIDESARELVTNRVTIAEDLQLSDSMVVFDEDGRSIRHVGQFELRIPREISPTPRTATKRIDDIASFNICWRDLRRANACRGDKERTIVDMIAGLSTVDFPFGDGEELVDRLGERYDGPDYNMHQLISVYRYRKSESPRVYVIREKQLSGRYPTAWCSHWTCRVDLHFRPGLTGQYRFRVEDIEDWPAMDAAIREFVNSLIVDNDK